MEIQKIRNIAELIEEKLVNFCQDSVACTSHYFLNVINDAFEDENNDSDEKIMKKQKEIDRNYIYNGQSLFQFLDTLILICTLCN